MNLYFTSEICDYLDLFCSPMALKSCLNLICNDGVQFQMEIWKFNRGRPRSVDDAELGHFTFLFCTGRRRNVQRFITHVHSYCFARLKLPFVWWRSRCRCRRGLLKLPINGSKPPPGTQRHQNNAIQALGKPLLFKLFSKHRIWSNFRSIVMHCFIKG